jgi:hypothetical protein
MTKINLKRLLKFWLAPLICGFAFLVWIPLLHAQIAFAPPTSYAVNSNAVWVTAADVNGDGAPDLLIANGNILIMTNNGHGEFGSNAVFSAGFLSGTVTAADLNNSGKPDLIWTDITEPHPRMIVYTNNGSGIFGSNAVYATGNSPGPPLAVDVNGDGYLDLICANGADKTLSVYTNNGNGTFQLASTPQAGSQGGTISLIAADVNGDGKPDLICANAGSYSSIVAGNTLSVMTNGGGGHFQLASTPVVDGKPQSLVAMDINGDGSMDLICACANDTLSVLTNNGTGIFGSSTNYIIGSYPLSLTAADFNGDGKLDLILANYDYPPVIENTLTILTNNGNGGFTIASSPVVGLDPNSVAVADVNGDGKLDLISGNSGQYDTDPSVGYFTAESVSVLVSVPTLNYNLSNQDLMVSWPSSWTNWTLLQNPDLATTNWSASAGVVNDGTNKSFAVSSSANNLFFRLAHP